MDYSDVRLVFVVLREELTIVLFTFPPPVVSAESLITSESYILWFRRFSSRGSSMLTKLKLGLESNYCLALILSVLLIGTTKLMLCQDKNTVWPDGARDLSRSL